MIGLGRPQRLDRVREMRPGAACAPGCAFMRASGEQLGAIAALVDAGTIRPVVDRVFPFESSKEAMAYVSSGRTKGKVVVTIG